MEKKINKQIAVDRTNSEIKYFRTLGVNLKEKQAEPESINLKIRYIIQQNIIVENTRQSFG